MSNSVLLTVMERIERMQEESLKQLQSLEATVKDNASSIRSVNDAMEFTGKQMEDVTNKVDTRLNKVRLLEKENSVPRD